MGLLSQFTPFHYWPHFSVLFTSGYHVYIWQVLTQLCCCDTCQIWMWFKVFDGYFWMISKEWSFSDPYPSSMGSIYHACKVSNKRSQGILSDMSTRIPDACLRPVLLNICHGHGDHLSLTVCYIFSFTFDFLSVRYGSAIVSMHVFEFQVKSVSETGAIISLLLLFVLYLPVNIFFAYLMGFMFDKYESASRIMATILSWVSCRGRKDFQW